MEALSYVVLVLLSLFGYSGGAAGRTGKSKDLKPGIADLFLIVLIWTVAIYSRLAYDFNKWVLIIVWLGISAVVGIIAVSFRKWPAKDKSGRDREEDLPSGTFKRLWRRWTIFSKRMGSFQSRVLLSLFFFVIISPVAFLITVLGDPLKIKKKKPKDTYWSAKTASPLGLEDFRRQF
jgi:hypothetical protein